MWRITLSFAKLNLQNYIDLFLYRKWKSIKCIEYSDQTLFEVSNKMSRKWHRFIIAGSRISNKKPSTIINTVRKLPSKLYFDHIARSCHIDIESNSPQSERSAPTSNAFRNKILHVTAYESHGIICMVKFSKLSEHILD